MIEDIGAPEEDGPAAPLLLTSLYFDHSQGAPERVHRRQRGPDERRCHCLFDELGFVQHLHTIRSTHKLTGEGVTFLGPDLVHVLEDALPDGSEAYRRTTSWWSKREPTGLPATASP